MRVYILTDIEGVSGISDFDRQCWPHSPDFEQAQALLTGEVNAAVQGAQAAGADTILVCDAHYQGHNILIDQLHPAAELVQGRMRPHWLPFIETGFDAFVQIGAHAMAGTPGGVLCHSMELDIVSISLNGQLIGEIGMAAAAAGSLGIPTVLVAGDWAAVQEMLALVPQVEGVAVKHGLSRHLARHLSPERARACIQAGMRQALLRAAEIPPYRLPAPYSLQVTYLHPAAEYLQKKTDLATRLISPTTIEYRSDDLIQLFKIFE
jgi:D-amino peptidase